MFNLKDIEKNTIISAVEYYRGSVNIAAKSLGIGRSTLLKKLKEYGTSARDVHKFNDMNKEYKQEQKVLIL